MKPICFTRGIFRQYPETRGEHTMDSISCSRSAGTVRLFRSFLSMHKEDSSSSIQPWTGTPILNQYDLCQSGTLTIGIDMLTLRAFKNEAEVLFNNQPIPIKQTEIFGDTKLLFVNHFLFIFKNRQTCITEVVIRYLNGAYDHDYRHWSSVLRNYELWKYIRFSWRISCALSTTIGMMWTWRSNFKAMEKMDTVILEQCNDPDAGFEDVM